MRAGLLGLLLLAARAAALPPLDPSQKARCEQLARTGFSDWRRADLYKLPPAASYPLELGLNVFVLNHRGFWSLHADEDEIAYHLERAREAYRPCGIEVVVKTLSYVEGPDFLDALDRGVDNGSRLTERERCLMGPLQKPGSVNLYFVEKVDSDKGDSTSHALGARTFEAGEYSMETDRRFVGAAVITDGSRSAMAGGRRRLIVVAHETGHVVMDCGHTSAGGNLMSDDLDRTALRLTPEQCEAARRSPFVTAR